MTTASPILGLTLYNSTTDQAEFFSSFRANIAGVAGTSNFYKIDTAYGVQAAQITDLQNKRGSVYVPCVFVSSNYYEANSITEITSLINNMTIIVKLDTTSAGTVTLNINALGTKSLMKINSSGTIVNIASGELMVGKNYLFRYDGTQWIWVSANSADQIFVSGTSGNILTINTDNTILGTSNWGSAKYPDGTVLNGRILPSVTSNNLTLSLKTFAGTDPSATDPIYVTIGGTVRAITSALSVTKNAGTNWFNAGSAELAGNTIDYFVYVGYNATDGVTLGFSRIPYGRIYSEFSATSTNEKYCGISTITNAVASDNYLNIGRFAATLSAGAGYTWTVPTYTNTLLIQNPIFETRFLSWTPTHTRTITPYTNLPTNLTSVYMLTNRLVQLKQRHQQNATPGGSGYQRLTLPFTSNATLAVYAFNESTALLFNGYTSGYTCTFYRYDGAVEVNASEYYGINGSYTY